MVNLILMFFSSYLIEFMGFLLVCALIFRWLAYRSSKFDDVYYSSFTRELELNIENDKDKKVKIESPDSYLTELLGRTSRKLPNRSLRFAGKTKKETNETSENEQKKIMPLRDYIEGKEGLMASLQAESSVFSNKTPPNFTELARRIISQDAHWSKLLGIIPIEGVSRMIDILPGLFIVLGVFGTFIGISMALPEIAKIDFNDLEGSGETLAIFVVNVTFAMKTSIAGIFFSLILTVLNTLFPIKDRRFRIFKKLENCVQVLWYHIQHDPEADKELNKVLPKMLTVLENLDRHFTKKEESDSDPLGEQNSA